MPGRKAGNPQAEQGPDHDDGNEKPALSCHRLATLARAADRVAYVPAACRATHDVTVPLLNRVATVSQRRNATPVMPL